jgi:integrase
MFSIDEGPPNPDRIGWWWQRARELSGIQAEWRLHDLRHWAATMTITSGHDVRTVAGRLDHANAAMTLRVPPAEQRRVYVDDEGTLRTDHALNRWSIPTLRFHCRLERKPRPSDR